MIDGLKSYPDYKESGVPWFGQVPEHWEIKPLKHFVRMNASVLPDTTEEQYEFRYLDIGSVGTGILTQAPQRIRFGNAPSRARRVVRRGDTIVSTVRTYLKAVYHITADDNNLICSTGFAVLTPRPGTVPEYVRFLAESEPFTSRVTAESVGIAYPAIAESRLGSFHIAIPPLHEQSAIVRFLNHADKRIWRYIRSKKKLITLLTDQKQAIIAQCVTRSIGSGMTSPVQLDNIRNHNLSTSKNNRQSCRTQTNIPWLTSIPNHWGISSSKRLFTVRKELALPGDVQLSATQAYGVIPQAEFEQKVGRKVVRISMHLEKRRHVEKDDFVISMRSFQGGLERAWASGCIRSSYVVIKANNDVHIPYFAYLFKSHGYIQALRATANFIRDGQDLNFSNFCLVDLPVVPLKEQQAIADYLDEATANINAAISKARGEVDLLHEFRTRLIADLVTGKLDVCEAAARLPDKPVELEPVNEPEDIDETDADDESVEPDELMAEAIE